MIDRESSERKDLFTAVALSLGLYIKRTTDGRENSNYKPDESEIE